MESAVEMPRFYPRRRWHVSPSVFDVLRTDRGAPGPLLVFSSAPYIGGVNVRTLGIRGDGVILTESGDFCGRRGRVVGVV